MARSVMEGGSSKAAAARAFHTTPKTVAKWAARFRAEGVGRLAGPLVPAPLIARPGCAGPMRQGRSFAQAAPHRRADRRGSRDFVGHRQPHSQTAGPQSAFRSRTGRAGPPLRTRRPWRDPPHRHQKARAKFNRIGHRVTHDRQSKARGIGWEYVHLAIDHSRLAYWEILPDEKRGSCLRFLFNALRFFRSLGVKVERVMTDNGSSFRSHRYAKALRRLRIKHLRTKPYTPKTNGKAERFVQTSWREWAYARAYDTSQQRAAELPFWLHRYNWHRPHGSIGSKPPISRIRLTDDNLLRLHS